MEFLISRWRVETHTLILAWAKFGMTLDDVVALTCLPMFGEVRAIILRGEFDEIALDKEDYKKLEALNNALS